MMTRSVNLTPCSCEHLDMGNTGTLIKTRTNEYCAALDINVTINLIWPITLTKLNIMFVYDIKVLARALHTK